jgi:hypothetical protein
MTLASPLNIFHRGSYKNNSPGTFRYHLVLPKRNMHYFNLIQVIPTLIRLDYWSSVSLREEMLTHSTRECRMLMDCTDTCQWRSRKCSCETKVMGKLTHYCTRIGTIPTRALEIRHDDISASIPLLAEYPSGLDEFNFTNSHNINTLRISSFYIAFCEQMKYVLRVMVCF